MTAKDRWMVEQILDAFQKGRDKQREARSEKDAVKSCLIAVEGDQHFDRVKSGLRTLLGWED